MHLSIRKINALEIRKVINLARTIWPACFPIFLTKSQIDAMLDSIYSLDALAREMNVEGHVFWIASIDGQDVGYASAYMEMRTVWIKKLYVLPEAQGSGVGKQLMHTATSHFSDANQVALYVNENNTPAIEYYEHMGFAIKRKEPVKMGPFDFIDCIMVKKNANIAA